MLRRSSIVNKRQKKKDEMFFIYWNHIDFNIRKGNLESNKTGSLKTSVRHRYENQRDKELHKRSSSIRHRDEDGKVVNSRNTPSLRWSCIKLWLRSL